jgi:hypothetical protein
MLRNLFGKRLVVKPMNLSELPILTGDLYEKR